MVRPALLSALCCAALGAVALAHQVGSVASPVAGRSTLLVDHLDRLFESAPASALSEITRVAGSAVESERRDLEFWLDQRLPRFYLPMTKRAVDDALHRSVLEKLARDQRLAVHVADLVDYVRIQQAVADRPSLERAVGASPAGRRMWPRYDLLVAGLLDRHIAFRARASMLRQTVIRELLPLARRSDGCDSARRWSRAACRYWLASAYDGESRAARARADLRASEESAVAAAAWSSDVDDLQGLGFFDEMTLLGGEWEYRSSLADWLDTAGRIQEAAQARKSAAEFEAEHARPLARLRERVRLDGATAVPDLTVSDTTGRVARLAEYRGRWTLVDLWGTWCGPSREEMAAIDRLFRAFIGGDDVIAALHAPVVPHKLILTPDGRAFPLAGDWEREARYWLLTREGTAQAAAISPDGRWTVKAAPFDTIALISGRDVVVGGLSWSATALLAQRSNERFWVGAKIGYRIDPASKALRPMLEPYESSCRAWGACGKASMDSVVGDPRIAFVVALPTSRRVGLYSAAPELLRTIDVGSPLFVSDGRSLGAASDSRTWMLWGRTNSEIYGVFAFGQVVATVHTTNDIPADWNFQSSRFKVLMNLHRLDGSPIALDIPLPDLPIGRDEDHLYVVDYGAKGRNEPSDRVVLLSYPIPRR
jgi:thiol-disulfide isomerase/thioredoxin